MLTFLMVCLSMLGSCKIFIGVTSVPLSYGPGMVVSGVLGGAFHAE